MTAYQASKCIPLYCFANCQVPCVPQLLHIMLHSLVSSEYQPLAPLCSPLASDLNPHAFLAVLDALGVRILYLRLLA